MITVITFNAKPLTCYASMHQKSFLNVTWLTMAFNFNLQAPIAIPPAQLTFNLRDASQLRPSTVDLTINQIKRWRMDISSFRDFNDYLSTLKSNYKKNYLNTIKAYQAYGAEIRIIDGDWSEHASTVYQLYRNVAKRNRSQLYDRRYFNEIAKINAYKLISVWHANVMVSVLVIFDEQPVYHSMLCGFDYVHSRNLFAYSLVHYELIRLAIATTQHTTVDIGITANIAKAMMNFKAIPVCMDITARNPLLKLTLKLTQHLYHYYVNRVCALFRA